MIVFDAHLDLAWNALDWNRDFKMDLDKMADAARGAGLVFYCNPNNPTATYVGARATPVFAWETPSGTRTRSRR